MAENLDTKTTWFNDLAGFIVEANQNTWAADKGEVEPFLPGHKTHRYTKGFWELIDDYAGYFRAPGLTVINYKDFPAWHMYYGGRGMVERQYDKVKEAFLFLREALMQVTPELPFRGPSWYRVGDWRYSFDMDGDIENATWTEKIRNRGRLVFTQTGGLGVYIHKTSDRQPQYPWDL